MWELKWKNTVPLNGSLKNDISFQFIWQGYKTIGHLTIWILYGSLIFTGLEVYKLCGRVKMRVRSLVQSPNRLLWWSSRTAVSLRSTNTSPQHGASNPLIVQNLAIRTSPMRLVSKSTAVSSVYYPTNQTSHVNYNRVTMCLVLMLNSSDSSIFSEFWLSSKIVGLLCCSVKSSGRRFSQINCVASELQASWTQPPRLTTIRSFLHMRRWNQDILRFSQFSSTNSKIYHFFEVTSLFWLLILLGIW